MSNGVVEQNVQSPWVLCRICSTQQIKEAAARWSMIMGAWCGVLVVVDQTKSNGWTVEEYGNATNAGPTSSLLRAYDIVHMPYSRVHLHPSMAHIWSTRSNLEKIICFSIKKKNKLTNSS
jgi:hypothetical protein